MPKWKIVTVITIVAAIAGLLLVSCGGTETVTKTLTTTTTAGAGPGVTHTMTATATATKTVTQTITPSPTPLPTPVGINASELLAANCAVCHGEARQGVPQLAPPLTPEALAALSDAEVRDTILNGRPGTAMIAWKGQLSAEEIDALAQFIKQTAP